MNAIAEGLARVRRRMAEAAGRAGRDPGEIELVAISKTHPAECVRAALAAGQGLFGENRIQEALVKLDELAGEPVRWHLVGHLQRNKARQAVGRFELIHSVDSVELIEELEKRAGAAGVVQAILLQINVSGEGSKAGARPEELAGLLEALGRAPHLSGRGLMTIPPWDPDPETARPHFRRLRELLEGIEENSPLAGRELSMGMSEDMEVAIEEGATLVRVGSAIFGERG